MVKIHKIYIYIIKSKKINSSKMNEILQVNDDDKYRKHYFMFTSEAKQFCLDLINIKKLKFHSLKLNLEIIEVIIIPFSTIRIIKNKTKSFSITFINF